MDTLGTKLKAARQKRKLTTSEAAKGTRIKVQHIEAIENDDFSSIAAPTYAKGFIRIYAEFLGLNPEPLIEEYTATHTPRPRASLIPDEPQAAEAPRKERKPLPRLSLPKVDWQALPAKLGWPKLWSRIRSFRWQPSPAIYRAFLAVLALLMLVAMTATVLIRRDRMDDPADDREVAVAIPPDRVPPAPDRDLSRLEPARPLPVIYALPEPYLP